jgi:hypothetical protein
MHAQCRDAIEFYTEKKIVVERWVETHSESFELPRSTLRQSRGVEKADRFVVG